MFISLYLGYILSVSPCASSLVHRTPAGIQVTNHVLSLVAAPYPHPVTPSSKHLHKRRRNGRRQNFPVPGLVVPAFMAPAFVPPPTPFIGPLPVSVPVSPIDVPLPPSLDVFSPPVDGPSPPMVVPSSPIEIPLPPSFVESPPPVGVSTPPIIVPSSSVNVPPPPDQSLPLPVTETPIGQLVSSLDTINETFTPRSSSSPKTVSGTAVSQPVDTIGGRVYMTNITLAGHPYTLIIDTGSSDTWIAASNFQCLSRLSHARLPQKNCGFGDLYDIVDSTTYDPIPGRAFGVKYSDGEYLMGDMGVEELSVGDNDGGKGKLTVRQTIGVVERGWWMGDGQSSGLMGLAYPTLASNYRDLNYTTIVGSLFDTHQIPPIFSLALSRPTPKSPTAGGLLAIGGIPKIPYTAPFVTVPVTPIVSHTYAFYTIPIDGFSITPPPSPGRPPFQNTTPSTSKMRKRQEISGGEQTMILDSGSTLLYLPDETADYVASLFDPPARYVPASNTYVTSCSAAQPRFGVVIAGHTFYVNPQDMMNREGKGRCTLAVQRQEDGDGVLGDAWLKNVLVVFDLGGNVVSIAGRERY